MKITPAFGQSQRVAVRFAPPVRGSQLFAARGSDRFRAWFPMTAAIVERPGAGFAVAVILGGLLSFVSLYLALAPLCLWIFFAALRIDYVFLNRMAVPPLAVLLFLPMLGMGIGVPMLASAAEEYTQTHALFIMQGVFIVSTSMLFAGYRLFRGRISPGWLPSDFGPTIASIGRPLAMVGLFLCAFDVLKLVVGWRTGSLDRGYAGDIVLEQNIGIWTFVGIFNRWSSLWFFLLPPIWRRAAMPLRVVLGIILVFYALVAFGSGSRGLMLIPAIYSLCGVYFFVDVLRFRPERWAALIGVAAMIFIYVVDVYRNTQAFNNSTLANLTSRLAAAKSITTAAEERQDFMYTTGRALIGVADNVIYEMTPEAVPFAGGSDILPAILWTWIPQKLAPNKPLLLDGNEIVVSYTDVRNERSFSNISLSADLYRRFGWFGIPVGMFLFGAFYGLFVRWMVRIVDTVSLVGGIALLTMIVGGIQNPCSATVLQTWWIWAYDMPKHLIPLGVVVYFACDGFGRGLRYYAGRQAMGRRQS